MADDSLKLRIANLALSRLGVEPIAGFEEDSKEARACQENINQTLRAVLRRHPWAFATKYADPMTLVDGAEDDQVNRDWIFAYEYPADCVYVRRLLTDAGRAFEATPEPFRIGREGDAAVIYTNLEDAGIEYTAIFDCPVALADELFVDAAAWLMAAELALSLSRNKVTARECLGTYEAMFARAAAVTEREQQQEPHGDAEWIRER